MSRPLPYRTWGKRSAAINAARAWHRKSFASEEFGRPDRYRKTVLGVVRNPARKPLIGKGGKL